MSTVTNRGPYAKTKRVRANILAIAAGVFGASGYRATTMKEIAARAGISESGLAHHFPSKDELLSAVLVDQEDRVGSSFPQHPGLDALLALLAILEEDSTRPGMVELHTVISAEATSPEHPAHSHYTARYAGFRAFAVTAFEALASEGRLRTELSPADLGSMYLALMDGLQLQWLYDRDAIHPATALRRFLASVVDLPALTK